MLPIRPRRRLILPRETLRRHILIIIRIPPRLLLRRLHRLQNPIIDMTPQQRALHVRRLRHPRKPLTRHQRPERVLHRGIVIRPPVEMREGGGPFFGIVFGHEGEVVRDVADFLAEEEGDVGGAVLDVDGVSF